MCSPHGFPPRGSGRLPSALLAVALVVALSTAVSLTASSRIRFAAGSDFHDLTLVYVGAEDCGPCRAWTRDYRPALLASSQFAHITYREVLSPHLVDLLGDAYWPEDLRSYRDGLGKDAGVPLWVIFSDGKAVAEARGLSEWRTVALPKIDALLRQPSNQP